MASKMIQEQILNYKFRQPMSARIKLENINVKNVTANFTDDIELQIAYTVLKQVEDVIEWKVIYVGSVYDERFDQILQQFQSQTTTVPGQALQFGVSIHPPSPHKIPRSQLLLVHALIITASYRKQQFIRIGYYVHNSLSNPSLSQQLLKNHSIQQMIPYVRRTIIHDQARVNKFDINWTQAKLCKQPIQSKLTHYFKKNIKEHEQDTKNQSTLAQKQSIQVGDCRSTNHQ